MGNYCMKKLNLIILTLTFLTLSSCGVVQTTKSGYRIKGEITRTTLTDKQLNGKSKISGLVYSRNDSTFLSSANISINKNAGTTSNKQGEFELELSPGTYNIRAAYIGHKDLAVSELKILSNQHVILIFELGTTVTY